MTIFPGELQHEPRPRRRGFTLVELLVVIVIIGILIAILLPAVQMVREAGRRSQCLNNLKQLGLGITGYEGARGTFPAAGIPSPTAQNGAGCGLSWIGQILPFIEQANLYNQLDLTGVTNTGYGDIGRVCNQLPGCCNYPGNIHNGYLVAGLAVSVLVCPSSPLARWGWPGANQPVPPGPIGVQTSNYTAILGSVNHPSMVNHDANDSSLDASDATGQISSGGVMILLTIPQNTQPVREAQVTDGLSNTLIVAEQSDYCVFHYPPGTNGNSYQGEALDTTGDGYSWRELDPRCDGGAPGFLMASRPNDDRPFNATNVRYAINDRRWENVGVGTGYYAANGPIISAHTGGAQGLMGDGSAKFLSESTALQTLYNLCDRDDNTGTQPPP